MAITITVSTLSGLYTALAKATGGETILLAAGDYGTLGLSSRSGFDVTFASNVTIKSADPGHPAVFTGMGIKDAANLTFDGITFDYTFAPGDQTYSAPFSVFDSQNITIRNSTFDGDVAENVSATSDGYGFAIGLSVRGTAGITLDNNEIFNFHRGAVFGQSSNITVKGNDIHSIRSDGMNFAQVKNVLIENNDIHDFRKSPTSADHPDMIQFWTNGTTSPSENITIRGNRLDIGAGGATQSIFMRNDQVDQGFAGSELYYRNVTIEENTIVNGHAAGIVVGATHGVTIRNNSVLHADGRNVDGLDSGVEIPKISVNSSSTGVSITNNATAALGGWSGQSGWLVRDNAFVQDQDPQAPGYYGDIFVSSSLQLTNGQHQFQAIEGGMLDRLGAGTTESRDGTVVGVSAQFQITDDPGNGALRTFDASQSAANLAALPKGTQFLWDFGDGTSASGVVVNHSYADGGIYDVVLKIKLPDGTISSVDLAVAVAGPEILSLVTGKGFVAYETGSEIALAMPKTMTADGIQLGAKGVVATVAREHVSDILVAEDFNINLTLKADVKYTSGELFRMHGSFLACVDIKGELVFNAYTTAGEVKLTTRGASLSDLNSHKISLSLADGQLQVMVDGRLVGSAVMKGDFLSGGTNNLVFGNPWGKSNFVGDLKTFEITKDAEDFLSVAQTTVISNPFQTTVISNSLQTTEVSNPLQTLEPISATVSMIDADSAQSDAVAPRTHPVFNKIFLDQDHHAATPLVARQQNPLPDLGDRFEFLAHHLPDQIMA